MTQLCRSNLATDGSLKYLKSWGENLNPDSDVTKHKDIFNFVKKFQKSQCACIICHSNHHTALNAEQVLVTSGVRRLNQILPLWIHLSYHSMHNASHSQPWTPSRGILNAPQGLQQQTKYNMKKVEEMHQVLRWACFQLGLVMAALHICVMCGISNYKADMVHGWDGCG